MGVLWLIVALHITSDGSGDAAFFPAPGHGLLVEGQLCGVHVFMRQLWVTAYVLSVATWHCSIQSTPVQSFLSFLLAFLAQNKSEMCNGACVLFYVRGWSLSTFRAFFDDCLPLGVDRAGTTLNLVHVALAQPQRAVGSNWYVISLSKTMVRLWSTIKDSSTALVVRVAYRLHAPPHATTRCLDQIPRSVT